MNTRSREEETEIALSELLRQAVFCEGQEAYWKNRALRLRAAVKEIVEGVDLELPPLAPLDLTAARPAPELLREYIARMNGASVTAKQIRDDMKRNGTPIEYGSLAMALTRACANQEMTRVGRTYRKAHV